MLAVLEKPPVNNAFEIQPLGPFSLQAAARFWGGFTPAAHGGADAEGHLHMAFAVEGTWSTVGVCVREANDSLLCEAYGDPEPDLDSVRRQTARILSLDVDGRGFPDIGKADPIAADLQRRYPGLRPVCFYSPYEAAVWAILSQRITMHQAAAIKTRLSEASGTLVSLHGQPMRAFPSPSVLAELDDEFSGLFGRKPDYLRAIARAALAGDLDGGYLRSLPDEVALARLRGLPGIGPFSAELILLRGAGHPDYLTLLEPRFRRAVADAYHFDHEPTDADLRRISDKWRPFRMWQTFLLRQNGAPR
jgi:DNA-3-methyladenine glycosylase II